MKTGFFPSSLWIQGVAMVIWMLCAFNLVAFLFVQFLIGVLQIIVNLFTLRQAKKSTPLVRNMIYGYWIAVITFAGLAFTTTQFDSGFDENWIVFILIPCLLAVFSLSIPVVATRN
ncbi:MAG: hypothetical protein GC193_07220 [Cryomorphaceae bacterium]|nr:hypothetical protein [Cryomorphaceae bacterium]